MGQEHCRVWQHGGGREIEHQSKISAPRLRTESSEIPWTWITNTIARTVKVSLFVKFLFMSLLAYCIWRGCRLSQIKSAVLCGAFLGHLWNPRQKKKEQSGLFSAGEAERVAQWKSLSWALQLLPGFLSSSGPDVFLVNQDLPPGGISIASGCPLPSLCVCLDSKKGFITAASGHMFKNTQARRRNLPRFTLYPSIQHCPQLYWVGELSQQPEGQLSCPLPNPSSLGLKSLSDYSVRWVQRINNQPPPSKGLHTADDDTGWSGAGLPPSPPRELTHPPILLNIIHARPLLFLSVPFSAATHWQLYLSINFRHQLLLWKFPLLLALFALFSELTSFLSRLCYHCAYNFHSYTWCLVIH